MTTPVSSDKLQHHYCALTVVLIMLLECPHYSIVRQRYFSITTLKDLFETVNTHTILDHAHMVV